MTAIVEIMNTPSGVAIARMRNARRDVTERTVIPATG